MRLNEITKLIALSAGLLSMATAANAVVVRHQHTDLPDTDGQDRWMAEFTFEEATFLDGQGVSVLFDPVNHAELGDPVSAGPNWDLLSLQPDVLLPAYGVFDGLALGDAPSLTGPFRIEYTWHGAGTPGALPFVYYDVNFDTIESGETVPEPGQLALVAGMLSLVARANRRKPTHSGGAKR